MPASITAECFKPLPPLSSRGGRRAHTTAKGVLIKLINEAFQILQPFKESLENISNAHVHPKKIIKRGHINEKGKDK